MLKKNLKWVSTFFVLTGIFLTSLNFYPINIFIHLIGVLGWSFVGYLNEDKAMITNFGLQIPIFFLGIVNYLFN